MNQPVDPPYLLCTYTQVFMFKHHCKWKRNPGAHQNVMSPAGPLLLCTAKGVVQGWEWRGLPLVRLGTASGGRLTGKLSPACLADNRQTSLTNEGLCLVHWGELSTSWPDSNEKIKTFSDSCKEFEGNKRSRSLSSM